jgi:predicted RNase H-like HicB family nuclease
MATYTVYIRTDQEIVNKEKGYLAYLPDLPGCVAKGRTRKETIERLRENIDAYLSLLRQSGESHLPDKTEPIELVVKEVQGSTLPSDYVPMRACERDRDLEWMGVLWDELMGFVSSLPEDALDWKPNPAYPSISEMLRNAAENQWHLVRKLEDCPDNLMDCLRTMRQRLMERLRNAAPEELERVTKHRGEDWTARKIIRSIIEHTITTTRKVKEAAELYRSEHS